MPFFCTGASASTLLSVDSGTIRDIGANGGADEITKPGLRLTHTSCCINKLHGIVILEFDLASVAAASFFHLHLFFDGVSIAPGVNATISSNVGDGGVGLDDFSRPTDLVETFFHSSTVPDNPNTILRHGLTEYLIDVSSSVNTHASGYLGFKLEIFDPNQIAITNIEGFEPTLWVDENPPFPVPLPASGFLLLSAISLLSRVHRGS